MTFKKLYFFAICLVMLLLLSLSAPVHAYKQTIKELPASFTLAKEEEYIPEQNEALVIESYVDEDGNTVELEAPAIVKGMVYNQDGPAESEMPVWQVLTGVAALGSAVLLVSCFARRK